MLHKYIFCGTWPRRSGGSICVSKRMAYNDIPKRWFLSVEHEKLSLYPQASRRRLFRVESHSRGRIFIGRYLKSAKIGRDIVIKASFEGDHIIVQPSCALRK